MKIAFVVQRYGLEVTGGAEFLCRLLAEHLAEDWNIEVFTTCAIDYISWRNEYPAGKDHVNSITVWRFPVDHPRDIKAFDQLTQKIYGCEHSREEEERWMALQGPSSSPLLQALQERANGYDFFIFVTYLYAHTFYGLPRVKEKALLIPLAHDEPPLYLGIFDDLFLLPNGIIYSTPEEAELVGRRFNNHHIPSETIGVGVDPPKEFNSLRFRDKYGLEEDFIIYVGRIDKSKGCQEMFDYFLRYQRETDKALKLFLMGNAVMPIPHHPNIIYLGQLPEGDKFDALQAAVVTIMPSLYESFSILLLESWLSRTPVIVNGKCAVLKGQCMRSNGGLYYNNYDEFRGSLERLLRDKELGGQLATGGESYVKENYSWPIIGKKYQAFLGKISQAEIVSQKMGCNTHISSQNGLQHVSAVKPVSVDH